MTAAFRKGLEPYVGCIIPMNRRVLLRAILASDGTEYTIEGADASKAVCHEIVDAASDCMNIQAGHLGFYAVHISAAGDLLDYDSKSARHCLVHEDDIVAVLNPAEVQEAWKKRSEAKENKRREANGLPLLEPGEQFPMD